MLTSIIKQRRARYLQLAAMAAYLSLNVSCAGKGLVTESYDAEFYRVPKLLPDGPITENQSFVVYSDNQSGWRVYHKFIMKRNWTTAKMFIFPFYQLYLFGNGVVGSVNWIRHVPDYGIEERRMVRDAVYAEVNNSGAAFILNVGDISAHDGRRPLHWEMFLRENRVELPLLDEIPYLPVVGNHECANDTTYGLPNFDAVFEYPRFYVVEFSDAALFVLDSNFILDQKQFIPDDIQDALFEKWFVSRGDDSGPSWLEEQLVLCDKPLKLVAMHHPPITCAQHSGDWVDQSYGRDLEEKRAVLLGLFKKHGVQVVFSGHDHLYQHNILKFDDGQKIHFVVGGGAGAPLIDPKSESATRECRQRYLELDMDVSFYRLEEIHHYFLVDVDRRELNIKVMEVTGDTDEPTRLVETINIKPN